MDKKTTKNKIFILLSLLILAIGLAISGEIGKSTTIAKYKTIIDSNSNSSTIAKWNIRAIKKDKTEVSMLGEGFKLSQAGDNGNWFFTIHNLSDVKAQIANLSKIHLRLDSDNFINKENLNWNFLSGDNPITFSVYLYHCDISEIVSYQKKDSFEIISLDEYCDLTLEEQINYQEIIDESLEKNLLLQTSEKMTFNKAIEEKENGSITYFYVEYDFSNLGQQLITLDTKSYKTFRVEWSVSESSGNVNGITAKYKAYQISDTNMNFDGLVESYKIQDKTYYLGYDEYDYFDYLNYISQTGVNGEPAFVFPNTNGVIGQTMKVTYSNLTDYQKTQIKNYIAGNTLESLEKVVERKTYEMYEKFLKDKIDFENSLGYLQYGLFCSITFDLIIEQVD